MKSANIATAKNQLSRLLRRVQRGESVLITERNKPIAQLVPIREQDDVVARLVAEGKLLPPSGPPLNVAKLFALALPKLPKHKALSKAAMQEREEGW